MPPLFFGRVSSTSAVAGGNQFTVSLRTLDLLLVGLLLLCGASVVSTIIPLADRLLCDYFRMNSDTNIPAWYSSVLLALAAYLAFECRNIALDTLSKRGFLALGALLLLMSCDEIARFHETLPVYLANGLGLDRFNLLQGRLWLLLGAPFVLAIMLSVIWVANRVLRDHPLVRNLMVLGFLAVLLGGVVLETSALFVPHGLFRMIEVMAEEFLEMFGTLLICASLVVWRDHQFPTRQPESD